MYDSSDPRSTLATASKPTEATEFMPAEYGKFYEQSPQETSQHARTWYTRGQNFLVAYSQVEPGAVFERAAQPDEYVILLPDLRSSAKLETSGGTCNLPPYSLTIVPPGPSKLTISTAGELGQFSPRARAISPLNAGTPPPICSRTPRSRHCSPGPIRPRAFACAPTTWTCRRSRAASAASGVAPRS